MAAKAGYLVGIDSGTQSTTVCAWSARGRAVARAAEPLSVRSPRPGWAEQDPRAWWRSAGAAIRRMLHGIDARRILAVGIAFQRETFTLVDGAGRFLRPAFLWLDGRATAEVEALAKRIGSRRYHRTTGKPLDVTSALARLEWLARHEPDCLKRADRWVDVGSVLSYKLTGRYATCVAGADTCGLVGLRGRKWIEPYLESVGLGLRRFPDLLEPGQILGRVTKSAARETGLPEGLPVVAAGGDGQVFNVGIGAAAPYSLSLTLGTSVVLGLPCPGAPIAPLFRTLIAAAPGYLLECVLQSGTYLLRWFVERFGGRGGRSEADWDRSVPTIPPGCEGLVTLPHWWGVRFPEPVPEARGATFGWSNHHTAAHFYRSLLEGVSFELRRAVWEFRKMFPRRLKRAVRVGGGGSRSRHWPQILADVLRHSVYLNKEREATALGAAILAGAGVGLFKDVRCGCKRMVAVKQEVVPDAARVRVYDRLYEKVYAPLFAATLPLARALGASGRD